MASRSQRTGRSTSRRSQVDGRGARTDRKRAVERESNQLATMTFVWADVDKQQRVWDSAKESRRNQELPGLRSVGWATPERNKGFPCNDAGAKSSFESSLRSLSWEITHGRTIPRDETHRNIGEAAGQPYRDIFRCYDGASCGIPRKRLGQAS